jgi:hypothetical protein
VNSKDNEKRVVVTATDLDGLWGEREYDALREYIFAGARLKGCPVGSARWERERLEMLLRADALAGLLAQGLADLMPPVDESEGK